MVLGSVSNEGHWTVVQQLLLALLLSSAPMFALLSWRPEPRPSSLLSMSTPIIAVEVLAIAVLLLSGAGLRARTSRLKRSAIVAGCAWIMSALVSTLLADSQPTAAWVHFGISAIHLCFGILLWSELSLSDPKLRVAVCLALACSIGIYVLIVYILALSVRDQPEFPWAYLGAGVTNVRHLGYYAVGLSGLAAGLLASSSRPRRIVLALVFLGFFMVFWSGGRGAFGAVLVQCLMAVGLAPASRRKSVAVDLFVAAGLALALSNIFIPSPDYGPANIFWREYTSDAGFTSGRIEIWRQTVIAILDRPWFGHGEAQFRTTVEAALGVYNHPHNILLQIFFQWGVVGTVAFILLVMRPLRPFLAHQAISKTFMTLRRDPASIVAGTALTGLIALSILDGPLFYPFHVVVALSCLAVLATGSTEAEQVSGHACRES
jgi:hypothetical protein